MTPACLDLPTEVNNHSGPVTVLKRQRRHTRQAINCDAKGSPANKGFPAYSRLPRSTQGYTTPPAHSVGPRRLRGIRTGDIVRINHKSGQTFTGRATGHIKNNRILLKPQGKNSRSLSATTSKAVLIAHGGRWTVSHQKRISNQT